MLKFALDHADLLCDWRWFADRWRNGSSWVEPYRHSLIEHGVITDGRSSFVVVRERKGKRSIQHPQCGPNRVDTQTYAMLKSAALSWELEFFLIEQEVDGSYQLHTGQWGTGPVYLTVTRGRLDGSWALADLRHRMSLDELDSLAVTRVLVERHRYTRTTLFRGIHQLTERARADYTRNRGLTLHYPEPAIHARPRELRPDVDVIKVYEQELASAVDL